jgi:ABC-type branched-subunit amino acid transport system substrate-binding protein
MACFGRRLRVEQDLATGLMMEVEKINAAGGLPGRQIELYKRRIS